MCLDNVTKPYLTPLLLAIVKNASSSFEVAKILLEHGAEVDPIDRDGCTPLHRTTDKGFTEKAELLIRYGADPNAVM